MTEKTVLDRINDWAKERNLLDIEFEKDKQASFLTEEITEFLRGNTPEEYVDAACDLIVFSTNLMKILGYNPNIAMDETLKEIESRKGEFNSESGKWEKYKDDYHQSLWYKADYSKAKIE